MINYEYTILNVALNTQDNIGKLHKKYPWNTKTIDKNCHITIQSLQIRENITNAAPINACIISIPDENY